MARRRLRGRVGTPMVTERRRKGQRWLVHRFTGTAHKHANCKGMEGRDTTVLVETWIPYGVKPREHFKHVCGYCLPR